MENRPLGRMDFLSLSLLLDLWQGDRQWCEENLYSMDRDPFLPGVGPRPKTLTWSLCFSIHEKDMQHQRTNHEEIYNLNMGENHMKKDAKCPDMDFPTLDLIRKTLDMVDPLKIQQRKNDF